MNSVPKKIVKKTAQKIEAMPDGLILLVLTILTVLTHYFLVPVGVAFLNSDFATVLLASDHFQNGGWGPFHFDHPYGGAGLTFFRTLFVMAWEAVFSSDDPYLKAQMIFTFVILPVTTTLLSYFLVKAYFSRKSAFLVGLITSAGFHFLLTQYGNDFYILGMYLGFFFLALRAKYENPFLELGTWNLFMIATLCGFSVYTYRATAIYILAFFIPWRKFLLSLRTLRFPRDRTEKVLFWAVSFFLATWFYAELFGTEIGIFFGKMVKVHGFRSLHLKYALFLGFLYYLKVYWKNLNFQKFRLGVFVTGATFGFLPEIYFRLVNAHPPLPGNRSSYALSESFSLLVQVPQKLRELFTAFPIDFNPEISLASLDAIEIFSVVLLLVAIWIFISKGVRSRRFDAITATAILCIVAFVRVKTYTFAPTRYLLPIFPVIIFSLGLLIHYSLERRVLKYVVLVLLFFHIGSHVSKRSDLVQQIKESGIVGRSVEVVQKFQEKGFSVVITDDYWHSHQYTAISREQIFFVTDGGFTIYPGSLDRFREAKEIGVLLTKLESNYKNGENILLSVNGEKLKLNLTSFERVGNFRLLRGVRI